MFSSSLKVLWLLGHLRARVLPPVEQDRDVRSGSPHLGLHRGLLRSGISGLSSQQGQWPFLSRLGMGPTVLPNVEQE